MKNKLILSFLEPHLIARTLDDQQGLKELFPQHKLNIFKVLHRFCPAQHRALWPHHEPILSPSPETIHWWELGLTNVQWMAEMTRLECPPRRHTPELHTPPLLIYYQELWMNESSHFEKQPTFNKPEYFQVTSSIHIMITIKTYSMLYALSFSLLWLLGGPSHSRVSQIELR